MKCICLALLVACGLANMMVESINSSQNLWTASLEHPIAQLSESEFAKRLGLLPSNERLPEFVTAAQEFTAPASFDGRTAWKGKMVAVRDQGSCGSCWAFAMTVTAADRAMIHGKAAAGTVYSPQYHVSCDTGNSGCNGGNDTRAWSWAHKNGMRKESCTSYKSGADGKTRSCPSKCDNGSAPSLYYPPSASSTRSESALMTQISSNGPVVMCFNVYSDFQKYSSGIYRHTSGNALGGHAVTGVGYGVENGTKYWIIQNSWGPSWGEKGFFRILRGVDHCSIESRCSSFPNF